MWLHGFVIVLYFSLRLPAVVQVRLHRIHFPDGWYTVSVNHGIRHSQAIAVSLLFLCFSTRTTTKKRVNILIATYTQNVSIN